MAWKGLAFLCLLQLISASPAPLLASVVAVELALITPSPTLPSELPRTRNRRGVISDITAAVGSDISSILSDLGSNLPSWAASGLIPQFEALPTGSAVLSSANVSNTDLAASPTKVLNVPGYGNWTDIGWNLRIHGNVYKIPDISNDTIDNLANKFIIGSTPVNQLPPAESAQAVNLTREIFVVQQDHVNVTVNIQPAPSFGSSGQPGGGGGATPPGGNQIIILPNPTTPEGDFDVFVELQNVSGAGLLPGNQSGVAPQRLNVYASSTDEGNATSYLVPSEGITIVSDIDDTLRVTKIWEPAAGLNDTFVYPFRPWINMPDVYANWSKRLPKNTHFHYLTTTPEQITKNYMQFIYNTYPGGSFDTRPLNFSDLSETLSVRKFMLHKIFQTFPKRQFILVGDTSNSDIMRDYPEMAKQYPGQVKCIFLRNISATDPSDRFPYDTSGFKGLNQQMYMFFLVPDDLTNLDVVNGQCHNSSIPQNLTFGYQNLPFGLSTGSGNSSSIGAHVVVGSIWNLVGSALIVVVGMTALGGF